MIVWSKQRGRGNRQGWLFTREEILWATKTDKYLWNKQFSKHKYDPLWVKRLKREANPYKRATNVWTDIDEPTIEMAKQGNKGERKTRHPCQKPLEALKRIILAHTNDGDTVLDPFGGSGSTLIACRELNRKCIIIEKDVDYYNTIRTL
jgi:DNA modification methylase